MKSQQLKHTAPVWPTTLRVPARPPKLIYFDLNHWIELSKANAGHRDGSKHRHILDACLDAVKDGKAIFPLSTFIYMEIGKIQNHRQRCDLREIIERISRFVVVTSPTVVATHEIEATLDQVIGPNPVPINTTNYLDWGVNSAFGRGLDFSIKSEKGEDVTEEARRAYRDGPEAFDQVIIEAIYNLNKRVIEGPAPQEESRYKAFGWKPESALQTIRQLALDEESQARRLDDYPNWRKGRIRDLITAREAINELGEIFEKGLAARGPNAGDQFFALVRDGLDSILNAMPSLDVAVTIKTSLHRDPNHKWKNNDIFDIGALALTIPYCDVVVADSSMCFHVTRSKLAERYHTVVIASLAELPNHL